MHQKDSVRKAWADAGLYRTDDAKLRQFLQHFDDARMECWPELVAACRAHYPEYKAVLAKPLWDTGDKLLRLNLIRAADTTHKDEVSLVKGFVDASHALDDQPELQAVVHLGHARLAAAVAAKPGVPKDLAVLARERSRRDANKASP